jgi:hypothetical protein
MACANAPQPNGVSSRKGAAVLLAGAVFVLLAWRQHRLVDRYTVNMLVWDQWWYYWNLAGHGS